MKDQATAKSEFGALRLGPATVFVSIVFYYIGNGQNMIRNSN